MTLPETMRVAMHETAGPIRIETRAVPAPPPGFVLIRVGWAGVNRPDLVQRAGLYPPPPGASDVMGLEVSGTIAAVGEGVSRWKGGEAVCALVSGGGYAEYCLAHEGAVLPVPAGLSLKQAALLPETVFTVWTNVFERAALAPGETFLVHGGTSGIGTTAIQMAKAHGARVFATAGSADKVAACRDLGADVAVNYREADFAEVLGKEGGCDVILDMVGGAYVQKNLDLLKMDGRLVQIAFLQGPKVELNLMKLMLKRLTLTGSTLRARPDAEKARIAAAVEATVWPWIADGRVTPVIDRIYPLAEADAAQARMDGGDHIGKIGLEVFGDA